MTTTIGTQPTLEEFTAEAEDFLSSVTARLTEVEKTPGQRQLSLFRGSSVEESEVARDWQRKVFDAGFAWIDGPEEYGGRGLAAKYVRAYQKIEREFVVPTQRSALGVSLGMVAPTLMQFGTQEAKQRWAKALYRGDAIGCQLFSEPGAGSDLAAVSAKAVQQGDNWIVSGQKVWTSGAHYSDVGLLLARTSAEPRHRNLTAFMVDMHSEGVTVSPLRQMTGSADFNEVFLDEVVIPDAYRLGEVDEGWGVAMATLMYERGAIGGGVGGGSGLFRMDLLAEWLQAIGRTDDPHVRKAYARVQAGVHAAKTMRQRAEAGVKAGNPPGPEMSLSKLALVSNLAAMSDLVAAALGMRLVVDTGLDETFAWTEFVLGVPGMRLGGGTDEVQRNIIAKRVLGLPTK
jgi:alkylation response protein AidB-like acyl-CoA dehydrogenase